MILCLLFLNLISCQTVKTEYIEIYPDIIHPELMDEPIPESWNLTAIDSEDPLTGYMASLSDIENIYNYIMGLKMYSSDLRSKLEYMIDKTT